MRNYTGVVAAALAAFMWLSFTLLPIGSGTRAGLGVGTFAVMFALAYAIKDRIKELTRGWITGRLMRLYGQRMVTLKLPQRIDAARRVLLETRETFDVDAEPFGRRRSARGQRRRHIGGPEARRAAPVPHAGDAASGAGARARAHLQHQAHLPLRPVARSSRASTTP